MNKQLKIEELLSLIYQQVDLKDDVYEFIQPFILKAYTLLRSDTINSENKKEEVLFKELEDQLIINNILYRDIPGIIDIYIKMPLEYRNEKIVNKNKTHRELLIENLEILANKLKQVEHNAYATYDREMKISNNLIKQKYEESNFVKLVEGQLEYEMEGDGYHKVKNNFDWDKLKKIIPQINMNILQGEVKKEEITSEDKKQALKVKQLLKRKSRIQAVVKGVNMVYNPIKNIVKGVYKCVKKYTGECIVVGCILTGLICMITSVFEGYEQRKQIRALETLTKIISSSNTIGSQSTGSAKKFKELNMKSINKFAKENNIELIHTNKSIGASVEVPNTACIESIEYLERAHDVISWDYYVNDIKFTTKNKLDETIKNNVCQLDNNKFSFGQLKF